MKIAFLLLSAVVALAEQVTVSWDANSEPKVSGYRVLYGTNSQRYPFTITVAGRLNTNVVIVATNVPPGTSYWVVQAFFTNGLSSLNSYEVLWTNSLPVIEPPPSPPRGLKLSATLQAGRSPIGPWTNLANLAVPMPIADDNRFFRTRLLLEELP